MTSIDDLDRQPERGDVDIRLGFPTYMGGDPADRERDQTERAVVIEITDGPSRSRILELHLSAAQFAAMLGGSTAHVRGAWLPNEVGMARIGKRQRTVSKEIHRDPGYSVDVEAAKVAAQYEADSIRNNNFGKTVIARRWDEITD